MIQGADDATPIDIRRELMELLVKSGRRCAYDLRHAADSVADTEISNTYHERADMWLEIFNPDGVKNYRSHLHATINELDAKIAMLKARCLQNGIDVSDIIPSF